MYSILFHFTEFASVECLIIQIRNTDYCQKLYLTLANTALAIVKPVKSDTLVLGFIQ